MGNFCIGDEGVNGIADCKHKSQKWGPVGGNFFMLKVCNSIYAQVTYAEIAFIHRSILTFLNSILDILNIIIFL